MEPLWWSHRKGGLAGTGSATLRTADVLNRTGIDSGVQCEPEARGVFHVATHSPLSPPENQETGAVSKIQALHPPRLFPGFKQSLATDEAD